MSSSGTWGSQPPSVEPRGVAWTCWYCDMPTLMTEVGRWTKQEDYSFESWTVVVARCTGCDLPYVLREEPPDFDLGNPKLIQLYPESDRPLPAEVPASIRTAHDEALKCRKAGLFTATTLMARRGVEAICAEHGQTNGSLALKLERLLEQKVIDKRLLDWSSVVRNLGNSGAHDVHEAQTRDDANDAVAFLEALVNYLYTFQERYRVHIARKTPAKKNNEASSS